jgi:hypothetical protein
LSDSSAPGGYAVFKNRDFALFLGSRFFAAIATQMLIMAVGWQVYHITGLDLFAVLFGGATALLPAYTRDVLAPRCSAICGPRREWARASWRFGWRFGPFRGASALRCSAASRHSAWQPWSWG